MYILLPYAGHSWREANLRTMIHDVTQSSMQGFESVYNNSGNGMNLCTVIYDLEWIFATCLVVRIKSSCRVSSCRIYFLKYSRINLGQGFHDTKWISALDRMDGITSIIENLKYLREKFWMVFSSISGSPVELFHENLQNRKSHATILKPFSCSWFCFREGLDLSD